MNIFRRCTTRLILPIFIFVFPAVALIFSATNVSSTEILSPAAVINNTLGEVNANTVAGNIINQSGLSASFTSRVTDFATYIAGNPTHAPLSSGNFLSTLIANGTAGILDFDLGGLFGVSNFIMWGDNAGGLSTDQAPKEFELRSSLVSDFSVSNLIGNFTITGGSGAGAIPLQNFAFATTFARFIRWDIISTHAGINNVNIGEIAFATVAGPDPIPEPSTMLLLGSGLAGLGFFRMRRKAA